MQTRTQTISSAEGLDGFTNGIVLVLDSDEAGLCRACKVVSACNDVLL